MSGNASHPSWHTPQLVVVTFVWSGLIVALVGMSIVIYLQHRLLRFKIRARMSADETAVQHVSCNHPMHLSCVDLTYTAPNGKRILDRVSLSIPPGEVVAVMGPSGSGKTTCLDVLAGRRRGVGTTEGRVFAAHRDLGEHASFEHFRAHSAYMLQLAQTFSPGLSVRENLIYAALLRMGSESFEACVARVDQIIIELGMKEIEHVIVGGATGGGISGGQKRKLMLGIELLASPSLLFLDEPTSGLDAASTLAVMNALRVVAATGRSILITIHQPRASVFAGFDRLLLLYNGSVAFFGRPLDAHQLLLRVYDACRQEAQRPSQGSAEGGVVDPDALAAAEAEHENPADFVLDCLGKTAVLDAARMPRRRAGLARPSRADAEGSLAATSLDVSMVMGEVMTRLFRTAGVAAALSTAILPAVTLAPPQLETVQTTRRATRGVREAWVRAWVLTSRLLRGMGVGAYLAIAVQHALVLVLMGSLFYRPTEPMVAAGSIFNFVMMVTGPMLNPVTLAVCDALFTTYQHEVAAGVVTPAQFLLHMLVFLSSWTALSAVPLMAGGQVLTLGAFDATKLGYSVAVALFDSQAFIAITLFTCCAVFYRGGRDNALPMILAGTLQSMYALFSGFFISKDHAPPYWGWLFEICPRYRSVTAAIIINVRRLASPPRHQRPRVRVHMPAPAHARTCTCPLHPQCVRHSPTTPLARVRTAARGDRTRRRNARGAWLHLDRRRRECEHPDGHVARLPPTRVGAAPGRRAQVEPRWRVAPTPRALPSRSGASCRCGSRGIQRHRRFRRGRASGGLLHHEGRRVVATHGGCEPTGRYQQGDAGGHGHLLIVGCQQEIRESTLLVRKPVHARLALCPRRGSQAAHERHQRRYTSAKPRSSGRIPDPRSSGQDRVTKCHAAHSNRPAHLSSQPASDLRCRTRKRPAWREQLDSTN